MNTIYKICIFYTKSILILSLSKMVKFTHVDTFCRIQEMSRVILRSKYIFQEVSNQMYFYTSQNFTVNVQYINQVLISCVGISFFKFNITLSRAAKKSNMVTNY